jgi:hypothetical protein
MGDEIIIESITIIDDKLFQIDLKNVSKDERYRLFIETDELLEKIGKAIKEKETN